MRLSNFEYENLLPQGGGISTQNIIRRLRKLGIPQIGIDEKYYVELCRR